MVRLSKIHPALNITVVTNIDRVGWYNVKHTKTFE